MYHQFNDNLSRIRKITWYMCASYRHFNVRKNKMNTYACDNQGITNISNIHGYIRLVTYGGEFYSLLFCLPNFIVCNFDVIKYSRSHNFNEYFLRVNF